MLSLLVFDCFWIVLWFSDPFLTCNLFHLDLPSLKSDLYLELLILKSDLDLELPSF